MTDFPPNLDTDRTPKTITQQALADLGITQLLSFIKHYSDIDFDATLMHLTDAEAQAIAQLLIQQVMESLNGKLIAGTLNTLRHSEEIEDNPYRYPTHFEHEREPLSVHSPTGRYNPEKPHHPRPITQREQYIIDLYCYCELGMTPRQFYAKWDVTYEQLSHICSRSLGMVQCWFNRGEGYYRPQPVDLRHLAIVDFLLEHFEELPPSLIDLLCSS